MAQKPLSDDGIGKHLAAETQVADLGSKTRNTNQPATWVFVYRS